MGTRWITLALFCVIFVVSCGDTELDLTEGGSTGTGISPTMGISHGSITAIGSISVNGVKFDTSNAKIIVEGDEVGIGDSAVLEHLAEGQVVTVEGEINGTSGTALKVKFKNKVKGPVTDVIEVDANTKKLVVLGQIVIIDDSTIYKKTTFEDVAFGYFVEVSGFMDDMGTIRATHLKKKTDIFDPNEEVEVKGTISDLNAVLQTFQINGLMVDYSSANKLPMGGPANDQFVEVEGVLDADGVLIAAKVELEDELGADNADRVEIEGFVIAVDPVVDSIARFAVGHQPVEITDKTRFEGGESFEITLGVKLEVEGVLIDGVLIADEVSFRDNAKLKSNVATITPDSADPSSGKLTLQGLGGITVIINGLTKITEDVQTFAEIAPGDHVEVRGRTTASTSAVTVIAQEVKLKKFDPNVSNVKIALQGPVDDMSDPFITIFGIQVDTRTVEDFEGVDDMEKLTREQFVAMVTVGDVVELNGQLETISGIVDWKKIELEDDD